MKNKFVLTLMTVALMALVFVSCKDDFTEEDALNAQQTITYNVIVVDVATQTGVEGAEVTIVQDGQEIKATTNASGSVTFKNIKIGSNFPVSIKKDGIATINTTSDTDYAEYRQAEISEVVYSLSLTDNLATVRGKVEIETDVTNDVREKVGTGTVKATFEPGNYNGFYLGANFVVEATITADGTYELMLPTFGTGVEYSISVNDLELDQKMAYNNKEGEPEFPTTLPKVEHIMTVFNSSTAFTIPGFVPAVFATVNGAPTGATPQVAELYVETDPDGLIDFIGVDDSGFGYPASTTVPVTISALLGGSGATANANTNASGQVTSVTIVNVGSGYPETSFNTPDATFNGATNSSNLSTNNYSVKPGDIKVRNIYYGTGSSRAIDIE